MSERNGVDVNRMVLGDVRLLAVAAPKIAGNVCKHCYFFNRKPGCLEIRDERPEFLCFAEERPDGREVVFISENTKISGCEPTDKAQH